MLEILGPVSQPLDRRRAAQPLRDPRRRRERLGQDHDHRQARAAPVATTAARSCSPPATPSARPRSSSCRSGASATACRSIAQAAGADPGGRDLRRAAVRAGARHRRADRRHRRPPAHAEHLMEELKKVKRVLGAARSRRRRTRCCWCSTPARARTRSRRRSSSTRRSASPGIVLTKLDGTAKGGIVLAIARPARHAAPLRRHRRAGRGLRRVRRRRRSSTAVLAPTRGGGEAGMIRFDHVWQALPERPRGAVPTSRSSIEPRRDGVPDRPLRRRQEHGAEADRAARAARRAAR